MNTEFWYSVQDDGEVRFMESKELCELDQLFQETPWPAPHSECINVVSDHTPDLLCEIANVHDELVEVKCQLEDCENCSGDFKQSEEFRRKASRLRRKVRALKKLQGSKETVKKTFQIEWPAYFGVGWLNPDILIRCLKGEGHFDTEITITEVE